MEKQSALSISKTIYTTFLETFRQLEIGSTPLCDCGHSPPTLEHNYTDELPTHQRSTWTTETTLEEKLWGTRDKLHSTAYFIEETSIKV